VHAGIDANAGAPGLKNPAASIASEQRGRGRGGTSLPTLTLFRPATSMGALFGAAISGISAAAAVFLLLRGLDANVQLDQLRPFLGATLFAGVAALFGYWTFGCLTLSYAVDRNALSIRWGNLRQVIPLDQIERLIPGQDSDLVNVEGVSWLGHHVGRGYVPPMGDVIFYSAHRAPGDLLYVETPEQTYGISVPDQDMFVQSIQQAQTRGPLFDQRQAVHRWGIAGLSFWLDPNARFMSVALIASFFAVLAYVLHQYPGLPASVALRFPSLGGVVRVGSKSDLLDIPRSALGFLAVDLTLAVILHSWERMVGYVLLLAGIAVQITLLIAAIVAVA
jgi:hypothetical protein